MAFLSVIFYQTINPTLAFLSLLIMYIPAIADTYRIFKNILSNKYIRWLISVVLFYVIYGIAEVISKHEVYAITHAIPDTFTTAIYFFNIISIPLIAAVCFSIVALIVFAIYYITSIFIDIQLTTSTKKFKEQINNTRDNISNKLGFENRRHLDMYSIFGIILILQAVVLIFVPIVIYFERINPSILHYTSYYENKNICSKVDENLYIKPLGDNMVSVSPYIYHNGIPLLKKELNDFSIMQCN